MPPTTELDQMIGFSLYTIMAVLNGRGNEIIKLARTNLFRCTRLRIEPSDCSERSLFPTNVPD